MKYYVLYILITLGIVLASQHAPAASFDCGKAATPAEKAICADPELSKLDSELNDVYSTAVGLTKSSSKLRSEQRDWLKRRDDCVRQTSKCEPLSDIYRARILRIRSAMDQEQCSTSSPRAIYCAQWEGDKADQELEDLLQEMKSRLVSPEEELLPEKAWEQYRDEECMSRMDAVTGPGGWEIYGKCNASLTKARIAELRSYHFCDVGGCPAQKP
jgi:uncharacterized protein